jgi:predicted AlkP superfamily pyrophosphatase or phosphodiesterase
MHLAGLVASLAVGAAPPATDASSSQRIRHVVLISVDGLRSDRLEAPHLERLPNFARLMQGPHTLEARTDAQYTITLPNHIAMVTGRPVLGPFGHNWLGNTDPPDVPRGGTLHINKGAYIASMFDVAHDSGVATSCLVSKSKFWLLQQSYGWLSGASDTTGEDNGPSKIDGFAYIENTAALGEAAADRLRRSSARSLDFIHFAAPDSAGHGYDWIVAPDSRYFAAVREVDAAIGQILRSVDEDADLRGQTAIVLTSDHGGGVPRKTHTDITCPLNFRIPFLIWISESAAPSDLYGLNPGRQKPSREEIVERDESPQPIRNGDAANAALQLLGLGPIPGSFYGQPGNIAPPLQTEARAISAKSSSN